MGLTIYGNEAYCFMLGYVLFLCGWIVIFVFVCLYMQIFSDCGISEGSHESRFVELLWTFVPTFAITILCCLNVFCNLDFNVQSPPQEIIKVTGHQWYWEVEQSPPNGIWTLGGLPYDAMMTDFVSSVDKPIVIEPNKVYQLLVTSSDVIHSFSVVGLGLKIDGCPGRLNSIPLFAAYVGSYGGYCAELCGAGHAYMPIVVECVKGK